MTVKKSWQAIAADAQYDRDESIASSLIQPAVPDVPPPEELPLDVTQIPRQILPPEDVRITELSPETLLSLLKSGHISAVSVTQAYLRRAGVAQKLANCVVELLASSALERAAELDAYLARHKRPIGPLHGLPISVKEHVSMKGLRLSLSWVALYGDGAKGEEDALPLQILWEAGAVFHARSTEPQMLMHLECSSNLYGVTVNPHNRNLSSGGSSGGEGALVGLRGSCLGIGTDIGGSIRSPAGNCGVYGLRPTAGRLPYRGVQATAVGSGGIMPVQGPLSASVEGLRLYCKTLVDAKPWVQEPAVVPIPWQDVPRIRPGDKLKIGVMWHDGVVKPHPPVTRVLREVVEGLKGIDGVQIHDFTDAAVKLRHDEGWDIISSLYYVDGGDGELAQMEASGEPLRPLTRWLLKEDGNIKRQSIEEVWSWQIRHEKFNVAYNQAWLDTGAGESTETAEPKPEDAMDVLLCPYFPSASSIPDTAKYWAYTSTWNLTDYPAMVFPVGKVDPTVDKVDGDFKPMSERDRWNHELYDPDKFKGAPVSLQLVARRFEEEKLLAIADFIVEELRLSSDAMI